MLIQPKDRHQLIMCTSLDEMLSKDNDVRYLDIIVDEILTINPQAYAYKGRSTTGRPAYSVSTMFKLYMYGYLQRIPSCRALERECNRNIELIWLLGDLRPDFKTIADFRKDNPSMISEFTRSFKLYLKGKGILNGTSVSLDGTKLKANASSDAILNKHKLLKQLSEIQFKISEYISTIQEDVTNKELSDLETQKHEILESLDKISTTGSNYYVQTDPDSRIMKSKSVFQPSYNGQIAVENNNHFIIYEEIIQDQNDINHLAVMESGIKEELSIEVDEILADSGYCNLDEVEKLMQRGIACYTPKQSQPIQGGIELTYNKSEDCYYCQAGNRLVKRRSNKRYKNSYIDLYIGENCKNCSLNMNQECTKSKRGRNKVRYHNQAWRDDYLKYMQNKTFKEKMQERKSRIEHVFGTIKIWMGTLQLKTRGIDGVRSEFKLWSTAYNMKKYIKILKEMGKKELNIFEFIQYAIQSIIIKKIAYINN